MYSILLKKYKSKFKKFAIAAIILAILIACINFIPSKLSNISPKSVTYSEFDETSKSVISFTPDYIVDTFVEEYTKVEGKPKTVTSIGFIAYDMETDKYYGIVVPKKYVPIFEEELERYYEEDDYKSNIPKVYGTVRKMDEEERGYFEEILYENEHIWYDLLYDYLYENDIDIETLSDEEAENISSLISELEQKPETLEAKTDFYTIEYKSLLDRILEGCIFFIIALIIILVVIIINFKYFKYGRMKKLKYSIETSHNFTEYDVEQDFNMATNIDKVWVGNKFIVLLAENDADLHSIENLAWAFVLKKKTNDTSYVYYLFTMDYSGNKNITKIDAMNKSKILQLIKEKCPNTYVGFSDVSIQQNEPTRQRR
ncbi:MAG: hypothetical protein K2F59_01915, partial [Eubacteriales bacterium]|nr:hypothetical protein [Eubacteriales bacterium]